VDQRTLLRKYERELKRLRAELLARQASLVDARRLLQVWRHALQLITCHVEAATQSSPTACQRC
jgi:hypothetical protein